MLRSAVLLSTAGVAALAAAAFAMPAAAQTAAAPGAGTRVQEVIVTAQKREQNLQDVPIVVTAVGGQLLRDSGVRDIKDLMVVAPGLTVTSTSSESSTTARIRGIGTVGDNPGLESSVGIVIDGVVRPRNGVAFGDLGETDRIEVLKGPQGTLFGKSTSAGVINIITAAPSFDFGADLELTAGNYGAYGIAGSVTGPIAEDKVAGRLYLATRKRDGFIDVVQASGAGASRDDNDQDFWTVRGQMLFQPNENVSIRAIADYTERDENCCAAVQVSTGTAANSRRALVEAVRPGSIGTGADPYARLGYANRTYDSKVQEMGVSTQADIDLGWSDLTSITAFRTWSNDRGQDSDFTALDIYYRPQGQYKDQFDTFSQEFRLAGSTDRLNWLVGAYYSREEYHGEAPLLYGADWYSYFATRVLQGIPGLIGITPATAFAPGSGQRDTYDQKNTTFALFTNDTFDITDNWDVTVGVRYTSDDKELTSRFQTTGASCGRARAAFPALAAALVPLVGAANATTTAATAVANLCLPWENEGFDARSGVQSRDEQEWSGTAKTSYRWNEDIMTYASYARGYKSGGFNFDRPAANVNFAAAGAPVVYANSTAFAPETVDAYELGIKTSWFNNALNLNAAFFQQKYQDFQLNTFLGTSFIVESIPEVTSSGVDVDFLYRGIEGLTVQGGVTYADTKYETFTAAQLQDPTRFPSLNRLPGSRLSFAPEWSSSVSATYEHSLGASLIGRANVSAKYSSEYNTGSDLSPFKTQDAFTVANARIGVGSQDKRWMLEGWVQNLTDEEYVQVIFNGPLQGTEADAANIRTYNGFLGAPRTYGLTLRVTY